MCIEPCDTAVDSKIQPLLSENQHDMNFKKEVLNSRQSSGRKS